jgi:hypothetical protein
MNRYYVHYEVPSPSTPLVPVARLIAPVEAMSESEAIKICKAKCPGSYGHRLNNTKESV